MRSMMIHRLKSCLTWLLQLIPGSSLSTSTKTELKLSRSTVSTVMKPQPSVSVTVREEAEDQNAPAPKKTKKTLGSFFKVDEDHRPASSSLSSLQDVAITAELQSYLLSAAVDSEENPLFWWKEHAKQFPALSKLAQKYLCIPATSSPSERVFSTGGNIVTCLRASLKPESVDRLVFLAKNL